MWRPAGSNTVIPPEHFTGVCCRNHTYIQEGPYAEAISKEYGAMRGDIYELNFKLRIFDPPQEKNVQ